MKSIRQEVKKHQSSLKLPNYISTRIKKKYNSLKNDYGVYFDQTILSLENNPSLADPTNAPNIQPFFGRKMDIFHSVNGTHDIIFSGINNKWIKAARRPYNIVFENSTTVKIESWSRLKSDSNWRNDHFNNGGSPRKSRFNGNLSYIKSLEFRAFNEGIGLLYYNNKIRMYLTFNSSIGKSQKDKKLFSVCVECERVPRRRETKAKDPKKVFGYKIKLHGYPVSDHDINKDFSKFSLKLSDIPKVN